MVRTGKQLRLALAAALSAVVALALIAFVLPGDDLSGPQPPGDPADGFGVGHWPPADWRPYADDSPFNQALPRNPRLHPNSQAIVATLTADGGPSDLRAGVADSDGDFQHPTYWPTPDDPVFTVHCTRPFGRCEVEGLRVRIPDRARPAGGSDAHMTVVDQRSGWEYDFWEVTSKPKGGGELTMGYGGRTRIDGDGLGSNSTAAHFGNLAGIIRAPELRRGRIEHALFLVAECDSGEFVYPAQGIGAPCEDRTNAPAEGMRFQLDMSDREIRALGEPRWREGILRALAHYGMFVGDTGGSPWDLEFESGSTYTSFGYPDPIVTLAKRLGIPQEADGRYHYELDHVVDWRSRLRVVDPCVTERSC
jgi:hypothetical protein